LVRSLRVRTDGPQAARLRFMLPFDENIAA
jgi:hypothetical protein